jgi:hypothetical protein
VGGGVGCEGGGRGVGGEVEGAAGWRGARGFLEAVVPVKREGVERGGVEGDV